MNNEAARIIKAFQRILTIHTVDHFVEDFRGEHRSELEITCDGPQKQGLLRLVRVIQEFLSIIKDKIKKLPNFSFFTETFM